MINILKNSDIKVYYQPIVCNKSKKLHKHEALMRLCNGDKPLSPCDFLEKAIEQGLYNKLSMQMLAIVFSDLKKYKHLNVSINISMSDIKNIEFCKFLFTGLKNIDNLKRVTFEVVETDKMDLEKAFTFFNELKKLGIKISMDDFGTGYSNFENLLFFDFDYLKIDGKFIKNIHDNRHASIVNAILQYCKKNNIKVVAEHVENEAIYQKVCELEIEFSQGYYIGKPEEVLRGYMF